MAIPVILRGETAKPITLRLADGYDYTGCTLAVDFCGVVRSFGGLAPGGTLSLAFTDGETAGFPLGTSKAFLTLTNAAGDTCRLPWAKIKVTDSPDELRDAAASIDVDPATFIGDVLPARYTDEDVRARLNAIINWMKRGAVGMLLALALPAFADVLTVQTAPKGTIYNDEQVVTNVTLDASGLATKGEVPGTVSNVVTKSYVEELGIAGGGAEVAINNVTNNAFKIEVRGNPGSVGYTNATTNEEARVKIGTLTVYAGNSADIQVAQADEDIEWPKTGNPPSNYDIYAPTESDPTVPAWAKAARAPVTSLEPATNYTDSVAAPIWQYVLGDRVWFAVTNYMRTVDGVAPSLQLWEVREGVTNLIYHSTEEITDLVGKATAPLATTQALESVRAAMPSKAWSRYQSATGADNPAPADVTIISTPVVQLTGGGEWTPHTLSAGGTVWTLESNGFTSISGGTSGYFSIRNTVTGEEVLTVEERSIIPSVPVNAAFEAKDGGSGFIYTVYADARPTLFTSTNLTGRAKAAWDAEGDDPNVVVNSWTNNGDGTWTADVTLVVPSVKYFAYVGVQESKDTVISNKKAASFDGGVVIGGAKYRLGTALINGVRVLTAEAIQ